MEVIPLGAFGLVVSRILNLPRRPPLQDAEALIQPMTDWLRAPTGTQQLRAIQAFGLYELAEYGGSVMAARVGGGKTLPLGLGAVCVGAKRPLLIEPAADVRDKKAEYAALRKHWRIPVDLKIISYHKLSMAQPCPLHGKHPCECERPTFLDLYRPDFIGCDECQALRYVEDSARARKFARYAASPWGRACHYMFASGTLSRTSMLDYAHMLVWALKHGAPVPLEPSVREEWSLLIDGTSGGESGSSGAAGGDRQLSYSILQPHFAEPVYDKPSAQKAFGDLLEQTPGVTISRDLFDEQPLTISPLHWPAPAALEQQWDDLRRLWALPDGWLLPDKSLGVWQAAQQMALGFFYTADPWPPTDWLEAYKQWAKFCRKVLESSDTLDSESQVADACRAGILPSYALDEWEAMRTREPVFIRTTVPVWLSTHAIEAAADWGREGGVIWSTQSAFGKALSERTGWPYYGKKSCDGAGRPIQKATAKTIIASTHSCTTSKNLQIDVGPGGKGYCRNLYLTPPQKAVDWEQRTGRTHRDLQTRPVHVDYVVGCLENFVAPHIGLRYAQRAEAIERQPQKILNCDLTLPRTDWIVGAAFGVLKEKDKQ